MENARQIIETIIKELPAYHFAKDNPFEDMSTDIFSREACSFEEPQGLKQYLWAFCQRIMPKIVKINGVQTIKFPKDDAWENGKWPIKVCHDLLFGNVMRAFNAGHKDEGAQILEYTIAILKIITSHIPEKEFPAATRYLKSFEELKNELGLSSPRDTEGSPKRPVQLQRKPRDPGQHLGKH